jgi:hypothetical protein
LFSVGEIDRQTATVTARAEGLAKFHTVEEIEDMWRRVLAASLERSEVNIIINQTSKPDGRSANGITLATLEQQEAFMADCREALASKSDAPTRLPRHLSFRNRRTEA